MHSGKKAGGFLIGDIRAECYCKVTQQFEAYSTQFLVTVIEVGSRNPLQTME
jgi:hypothetical protein